MSDYDHEHWEELLRTIIDRIGAMEFEDLYKKVLRERVETLQAELADIKQEVLQ